MRGRSLHIIPITLAAVIAASPAWAFTVNNTLLTPTEKNIQSLGTGIAIALPLAAGSIALYKHDRVGAANWWWKPRSLSARPLP